MTAQGPELRALADTLREAVDLASDDSAPMVRIPRGTARTIISALERAAAAEVERCKHCGEDLKPQAPGADFWVHAHGLHRCQSDHVAYGHNAEPFGQPCRSAQPNPCLGAQVEGEKAKAWVCDGCMRTVTRAEIADMADGEHVLCKVCAS